ncbi:MAG: hypothetical protein M1818_007983 [Claussenomyces sp. TS43310]|nr:MAG: hypothetical protein M1818_007983 [Claussenomyces sp. TS43310]
MRELDPLISAYTHEKTRPREKEALRTLQKVASLVKPIIRARNWRVGTLAEFYPAETSLLGLNYNKGQKICLRLRYPGDANQFLPLEQVVDTMLHELSHIVFGPHDDSFHALWNQLREEQEGLIQKGYTGEGFLSEGKRLGGRAIPRDEARRIARNAAEKRRTLTAGSGQKLGGVPPRPGQDIRRVIVDAIDRRNTVLRGCGVESKNADEIKAIADQATSNGFRTKAEEDKANEEAISQALWELVQEEEKTKYGEAYVHPTAENPTGNGGRDFSLPPAIPESTKPKAPPASKKPTLNEPQTQSRPISRLVSHHSASGSRSTANSVAGLAPQHPSHHADQHTASSSPRNLNCEREWICPVCTCHNPESYLCCDACMSERPVPEAREYVHDESWQPPAAATKVLDRPAPLKPKTWTCHNCGKKMEEKWWTCDVCGILKLRS